VPTPLKGTVLKHRRSATANAVPSTGNLELGELALNSADGYVYLRRKNVPLSIDEVVRLRASSLTGSGENFSFEKVLTLSTPLQLIDTFPLTEYRTLKYVIQMSYAGDYHSTEILLMHNDVDVHITEYATIYTDSSLGVITAVIADGAVKLLITPTFTNTTIKGFRTGVAV
jgi:hypothetical protein